MRRRSRQAAALLVVLALGAIVIGLFSVGSRPTEPRFALSGVSAYVPSPGESFSSYVQENRRRVRLALSRFYYNRSETPFGAGYPLDRVVDMRSPFEIEPDSQLCSTAAETVTRGFLLLHGLTDSPYLMKEVSNSLARRYPCARQRSLLTPGHGTVPGDLLEVSLDDWRQVVRYGIDSFSDLSSELYIVGYSNGATLALDYLQRESGSAVSGLILLSPGLGSARSSIAVSPYLKFVVPWISRGEDRDPAKYDSMPTNAAALFYRLTRAVTRPNTPDIDVPVFMAVSGDDQTVNASASLDYFCQRITASPRQLLWYASSTTGSLPPATCDGVEVVEVNDPDGRYLSLSHVAINMPPENPHYGLDGYYPVCSAYSESPDLLERCRSDVTSTVYGENSLRGEDGLFAGKLVRRASFNLLYDQMLTAVGCFIEQNCPAARPTLLEPEGSTDVGVSD